MLLEGNNLANFSGLETDDTYLTAATGKRSNTEPLAVAVTENVRNMWFKALKNIWTVIKK